MHHSKPVPAFLYVGPPRRVCPVCGSRSYSRDGIHPQCAQQQADAPRIARLKAEKLAAAGVVKTPAPSGQRPWHRPCPRCKAQLHIRVSTCACGYTFPTSKAR